MGGDYKMIKTIPLEKTPNQLVTVSIDGDQLDITLKTRLGKLYASVKSKNGGVLAENRVCLDRVPITNNLVFIDVDGNENPNYSGLNGRFLLVWQNEQKTVKSNHYAFGQIRKLY